MIGLQESTKCAQIVKVCQMQRPVWKQFLNYSFYYLSTENCGVQKKKKSMVTIFCKEFLIGLHFRGFTVRLVHVFKN